MPPEPIPISTKLMVLPAVVLLGMGLWSAKRGAQEIARWSPSALAQSITATEAERLERHMRDTRPGAYELVCELQRLIPDDAVVFGFYPDAVDVKADPTLYRDYEEALLLLGELQLLLYPTSVQIMPPLAKGLAIPPGAPKDRMFALDMNFPDRELLYGSLEPIVEMQAGTLLGFRGVKHVLLAEPNP